MIIALNKVPIDLNAIIPLFKVNPRRGGGMKGIVHLMSV